MANFKANEREKRCKDVYQYQKTIFLGVKQKICFFFL